MLLIAITFSLISIPVSTLADWKLENPRIVSGTLSERESLTMAPIGNGRILLFGGRSNSALISETWIYDINKNRWTLLSPSVSPSAARGVGAAYLGWESVLVYGGQSDSSYFLDKTYQYDYATATWTDLSPSETGGSLVSLADLGICYIADGKVLLFGGRNHYNWYNNTWLYDKNLNQWQLMSPTVVGGTLDARSGLGMTYIGDDKVVMFGGHNGSGTNYNDTWVYDLSQNEWTEMSPTVVGGALSVRDNVGMTYIGGDQVLLFGGRINGSAITNEVWLYDLSDNEWTNLTTTLSGTMPGARSLMGFAYAGLGKAVMFGGYNGSALKDTWHLSIPNNIEDTITWEIRTGVMELNWSVSDEYADAQFSLYRDGVQISSSVIPGAASGGVIPYIYLDSGLSPNKIYRYQIKEIYPVMNSLVNYIEIAVPYCD